MWILTRLIITIASFLYRILFRNTPVDFPLDHNGVPYSVKGSSSSKRSRSKTFETPVSSTFICTLSEETSWDRFAKIMGFGDEIQVHDPNFNRHVFILGDHPLTAEYLGSSRELRERICELIPNKVRSISITGETLKFVTNPNVPESSLLDDLVFMRSKVGEIQHHAKSRFTDPYYTRAVVLESLIMAVMTFGWISFAEIRILHEDYHLDGWSVFKTGLTASVVIAACVVALTWSLLRKSSRAIRLMIENALLLLLTLPLVGYGLISDVNRGLDDSETIVVTSQVVEKYTETHGSGRRRYTTYHLSLAPPSSSQQLPFEIPRRITVTAGLYSQVNTGEMIDCEIGSGYLGFPWYRSVLPHTEH
jgi:hypothetical protein